MARFMFVEMGLRRNGSTLQYGRPLAEQNAGRKISFGRGELALRERVEIISLKERIKCPWQCRLTRARGASQSSSRRQAK